MFPDKKNTYKKEQVGNSKYKLKRQYTLGKLSNSAFLSASSPANQKSLTLSERSTKEPKTATSTTPSSQNRTPNSHLSDYFRTTTI